MQIWLSVWDSAGQLEEIPLLPLPSDIPAATLSGVQQAKRLALRHATVADARLQLQILDDAGYPLAAGPERDAMEQAIQAAFRNLS